MRKRRPLKVKEVSMFVNNPEIDEIFEFAECVAAMPDPSSCSKSLADAKAEALTDAWRRSRKYRSEGFRNDLVHVALMKRLKLIKKASTVAEVKEILAEPKPRYTGNGFVSGPWSVPEEEMMCWSLASLRVPPSSEACERYMQLFRQAFGFDPRDSKYPEKIAVLEVDDDVELSRNGTDQ